MIVIWVEECLPDTFPPDFRQQRPERYWELSGWCRPVSLGNAVLQHRPWAKYVYESWVWRFLHQEIFRHGSLTWAGNDAARDRGGANGAGGAMNAQFESLFDSGQRLVTPQQYEARIQQRAALMDQIRNGLVHPNRNDIITGWLVTEMLVAFHPYFSDVYKPIDHAQNIEVLIRDTKFLVEKARELDGKLRSARRVYDLILGREGAVCRISGVPSPALQRYVRAGNESRDPDYLDDDSLISLIVVPGLVRLDVTDSIYDDDDTLTRTVVRHARAFAQTDLLAALRT
ncbi:hypothetical protein UCDDA912_g08240 [Diaporthe ampelina]|uniref:Uncharacterized protein n=1 Tax=Diaporthe ampelina TaxID=1214573 RepID=A0A0G2HUR4_9PEZI|nr:hypothetical protein UCDDA912_g08240 [Diaporthe ampelina]